MTELLSVSLDDKYRLDAGRVFINGTQALVRLPLMQARRDRAAGLRTGGYISGYRGSPLGNYDRELWQALRHLEEHEVKFEPGLNEDIAATAVWGTQQLNLFEKTAYDGVFAIWYGKNPGLDRSGDAIKHGNAAGSSAHGGVLAIAGDDHAAKSSDLCNQSEYAMMNFQLPVLAPADIQDVLDLGLYGWAMSRYSGCWTGFKYLPQITDRAGSVDVDPGRVRIVTPDDFELPEGGLNVRWPDSRFEQEERMLGWKLDAAKAFARANALDRTVLGPGPARLGIVTAGKAFLDVRQALIDLGIDEAVAREAGVRVRKLALTWPIEPEGMTAFADGLDEILVVEEKQPVIQDQLTALFYNMPGDRRPRIVGKADDAGRPLVSPLKELDALDVARVIAGRIDVLGGHPKVAAGLAELERRRAALDHQATGLIRKPYFCSGCPHNTSTRVPEGSRAMGGIGCHWMAIYTPEFHTEPSTQMGAEGAHWLGQCHFANADHMFQNLGDGTYSHSGSLAVRAAINAGANITYKILFNDAVAMTGGQPVEGGGRLTVPMITRQMRAEGVERIAVVSDEPEKYEVGAGFAAGTTVHHREELDEVQRELREWKGVTVLVYDQTCAAEKRRRRKRGRFPDPSKRVFINDLVCEGCGDCNAKSNCISVEPLETEFGRKRRINQSSCNKDFSCLQGFCPSFVTVYGGEPRRQQADAEAAAEAERRMAALPEPAQPTLDGDYNILVTGIGGTGVVTIGALLGMAAHLERKGCSVLDSIGLAQKNGAVISEIRLGPDPAAMTTGPVPTGRGDLVLACDMVVAGSAQALRVVGEGRTRVLVNDELRPTADFAFQPDLDFGEGRLRELIAAAAGPDGASFVPADRWTSSIMGDAIGTNLFMVGHAYQSGLLPLSAEAIEKAVSINGVATDFNIQAFRWGRLAAADPEFVERAANPGGHVGEVAPRPATTLDEIVERRADFLVGYQNRAYAERYRALVTQVAEAEKAKAKGRTGLAEAVARSYFKVLAYKDEYEVARLYADPTFKRKLAAQFEGDYRLEFNLAPPLLARKDPRTGLPRKSRFGPWMMPVFRVLAGLKGLRGTPFDPFAYSKDRRLERRLIGEYERLVERILDGLDDERHGLAIELAGLPMQIRGYGHVKERNAVQAQAREQELVAAFDKEAVPASAAE